MNIPVETAFRELTWKTSKGFGRTNENIISNQLDTKLGQFMHKEIDSVLRKIKNRKATGFDEIPPEVWKTREFDDTLLQYYNAVYSQNAIYRLAKGCIFPFPMNGDFGVAKNYWGGQDLPCSITQQHRTQNWEDTKEEPN